MSNDIELKVGEIEPKKYYKILNVNDNCGPDSDYTVTFRITDACDLQCNYCHWYGGPQYKYEDICSSIDFLFEFFKKQQFQRVMFYFHGGEPTRHKKVLDVLKYIKAKGDEYNIVVINEMQTNLTLKQSLLTDILPYCDLFDVSFHYLELTKKGKKLADFMNNYNYLRSINQTIHSLDIMLENVPGETLPDFYTHIKDLLSYDNIINSEMIYGFCHYLYNEETAAQHLAFYNEYNKTEQKYDIDGTEYNTNDLFKKGIACVGWHCSAGTQSITINGDGNVFHCGIHMTNYLRECIPEVPYTNLLTDKSAMAKMSILYKTGTKCRWDYCGGDFYLERTKP